MRYSGISGIRVRISALDEDSRYAGKAENREPGALHPAVGHIRFAEHRVIDGVGEGEAVEVVVVAVLLDHVAKPCLFIGSRRRPAGVTQ